MIVVAGAVAGAVAHADEPLSPREGVEAVQRAVEAAQNPLPSNHSSARRESVVGGRIVRPDGQPLRRASIELLALNDRASVSSSIELDDEGRFERKIPGNGVLFLMTGRRAGLAAKAYGPFPVTEAKLDLGEITAETGFVGKLRFLDPHDQPVAGTKLIAATLWVKAGERRTGTGVELPESSQSDQDGIVEYASVSEQPLEIEIWKPGFQYAGRELSFRAGRTIDWTLQPARSTVGQIVDAATKQPIAQAEIWLASRTGYRPRMYDPRAYRERESYREATVSPTLWLATSDKQGRFSIQHWRDDCNYSVLVFAREHRPVLMDDLRSGQRLEAIELEPPLEITGQLQGDLSRLDKGPGNSRVLRYRNDLNFGTHNYSSLFETTVGKDGRFQIVDLVAGDVELLLPDRSVNVPVKASITDWQFDLDNPRPPDNDDRQSIVVQLQGSAGQPLKGTVQLHWTLPEAARSGLKGKSYQNFSVEDAPLRWSVPPGATVWINDIGLIGSILREHNLGTVTSSSEAVELNALLDPAGAVSGRVLDSDGTPVSEFSIDVDANSQGAHRRLRIASESFQNREGRFAIDGLPLQAENEYRVFAVVSGTHRIAWSEPFAVSAAKPVASVDVRVGEAVAVRGRLFDDEGRPRLESPISVSYRTRGTTRTVSAQLKTDNEGRFATDLTKRLPADGRYEFEIRPNPVHAGRTLELSQADLAEDLDLGDIRLRPGMTIAGTIVGIDGKTKQEARLIIMPVDHSAAQFRGARSAASDAEGHFQIDGVEPVQQRLMVLGSEILEVYGAFELIEDDLGNKFWAILPHPSNPETTIIVDAKE